MNSLTKKDQLLLLEIYNNRGVLTKKNQKIFNSKFYTSINKLIDFGLVGFKLDKRDKRIKEYYLKDSGKFLSIILLGFERELDYMIIFLRDPFIMIKRIQDFNDEIRINFADSRKIIHNVD